MYARRVEFSYRTRRKNIEELKNEAFDLLVIGGGITGTGVAWDAASRGLKVALVEKNDFAEGTSSRSSKLIHGGLRYLENKEFGLVFEALSERSYLLRSCPNLVRPLAFYMPIYKTGAHPANLISAGMWLYDMLALFRTPALHKRLSKKQTQKKIPFLKSEDLVATFRYFDASMWDDALTVEVARKAHDLGAILTTRVEAIKPIYNENRIQAYRVRDRETNDEFEIKFSKLILCVGAWSDVLGAQLAGNRWRPWIAPSRGLHLVFDWKKIPLDGAVVMEHPRDGRISFVIPRKDYGPGITFVGTTDGPATLGPDHIEDEKIAIEQDTIYLLDLLNKYFPSLNIKEEDIINHTIGLRPLVNPSRHGSEATSLQKVSREHTIEEVDGHAVMVAGGKYTTFRLMAEEIVDFALKDKIFASIPDSETDVPIVEAALKDQVGAAQEEAKKLGWQIPEALIERYGAEALEIYRIHMKECKYSGEDSTDPEGFPCLEAQFRFAIRYQMVMSIDDFMRRRLPIVLVRKDRGAPWMEMLKKVWVEETQ